MHNSTPPFGSRTWISILVVTLSTGGLCADDTIRGTARPSSHEPPISRLIDQGVYAEALRRLEEELARDPANVAARRLAAAAALELEEYERLLYHAAAILQLRPEDPEALAWQALADEKLEELFPILRAELEEALERDPGDTVARRRLIELFTSRGMTGEVVSQFQTLLELEPDNAALRLDYARNLSWLELYVESLEAYAEYLEMTDARPEVRVEIARVKAWAGHFGDAVRDLREFLEEYPDNLEARALLADIYRWNDDTESARELYLAVLEIDPEYPQALEGMRELEILAELRRIQAQRLSIPALEERIEEEPDDWEIRRQLARLYGAQGRYEEAEAQLLAYLLANPDRTPIIRDYAFALAMQEKYDEAITQMRRYLRHHPEDFSARLMIADWLMWKPDIDQARVELAELLETAPDHPTIHWHLARIHHMHEEWEQALYHYGRVREIDPGYEVVDARIRQIETHPRYRLARLQERILQNPDDLAARLELANELLNLDRFFEARVQALAILERRPGHEEARRIARWTEDAIERFRAERISELRVLLREDPDNLDAILEMAQLLKGGQDAAEHAESVPYFQYYLDQRPEDREVRRDYAEVLSWLPEQRREAARELAILLRDEPSNIDLRVKYLEVVNWLDQYGEREMREQERLESELRAILRIDPDDVEAHLWMARLYQISENWRAALYHYRIVLALSPMDPSVRDRIAEIQALPEFRIAEQQEKLLQDPMNLDLRMELARIYFDTERYSEAQDEVEKILAINPRYAEAQRMLRYTEDLVARQRGREMRELRAVLREDPQNYEAQLDLGRLLMWNGDYTEAIRRYQVYLRQFPDDTHARLQYAQMLSWLDTHREEAIQQYREILTFNPDNADLRLQYARVLSWEPAHWEESERQLEEVLFQEPGNIEARVLLADVYRYQGRYRKAREIYEEVLALEPPPESYRRGSYPPRSPPQRADPASLSSELFYNAEPGLRRVSYSSEETPFMTAGINRVAPPPQRTLFDEIGGDLPQADPVQFREPTSQPEVEPTPAEPSLSQGGGSPSWESLQPAPPPQSRPTTPPPAPRTYDPRPWETAQPTPRTREPRPWESAQTAPRTDEPRPWETSPPPPRTSEPRPWETAQSAPWTYDPRTWETIQSSPPSYDPRPRRSDPAETRTRPRQPWEPPDRASIPPYQPAGDELPLPRSSPAPWEMAGFDPAPQPPPRWDEIARRAPREPWEQPQAKSLLEPWQWAPPEPREPRVPALRFEAPETREPAYSPPVRFASGAPQFGGWEPPYTVPTPPRSVPTTLPGLENFYEQAVDGLLAIRRELRPQANFLIGYTADNENYSEFQFGAQYIHSFRDGTRLYFGYSYFNFRQRDAIVSRISANVLTAGIRGRLADRLVGTAELSLNLYSGPADTSVSGVLRGDFEVNPFNTAFLEIRRYDIIHEVKTVDSLAEGISATRAMIGWESTPPARVTDRPFLGRVFFDGHLSVAGFSDGNTQTSFLLRPYYRVLDEPGLDIAVGWRGLFYERESPFYWSPSAYQGPLLGVRVTGEMIWNIFYDARYELFFPSEPGGVAQSLSLDLRRQFTPDIAAGLNAFLGESPRLDDFNYRNYAIFLDVVWQF